VVCDHQWECVAADICLERALGSDHGEQRVEWDNGR